MISLLQRTLLSIDIDEVSFAKRGFHYSNEHCRDHLETIGRSFLHGYHAALSTTAEFELVDEIESLPSELIGFGYEGAAMSLALLDTLFPLRHSRWQRLLDGPGAIHMYMLHVGYGWAIARIPWRRWRKKAQLKQFDPLLRWLVVDGWGFHEGYFHWKNLSRRVGKGKAAHAGYFSCAFDQGLGRSMWFVFGADTGMMKKAITSFPLARQADILSGIGLASAYAGGASPEQIIDLFASLGNLQPHFAQGVCFAAEARRLAGNWSQNTEELCQQLLGLTGYEAAEICNRTRLCLDLHEDGVYESWRRMIREHFRTQQVLI